MERPRHLNRRVVLKRRPEGLLIDADVELIHDTAPELGEGEALLRIMYLGMDATVRTWLNRGEGYLPAVEIGETVRCSAVGRVIETRSDKFAVGDLAYTLGGWAEYCVIRDDVFTTPLPPDTDLPAMMSVFGATMSLPGLAGIALTVGMSVDANVLINERIREELRAGLPPQKAISEGYDRASGTILDANITAFLAGLAMFAFGTGPLKGFGVTTMLGIATSAYTAVSVSRGIATLIYGSRRKLQSVAI